MHGVVKKNPAERMIRRYKNNIKMDVRNRL
jgi:hypothetical protein